MEANETNASTADRSSALIPSEFVRIPCIIFKPTGIVLTEDQQDKRNFTRGPMYYISVIGLLWCITCETAFAILATSRGQADFRQNLTIAASVIFLLLASYVCVKVLFDKRKFVEIAKRFEKCFPMTMEEQRMFQVGSCVKQANFNMLLYTATQIISISAFDVFPQMEILVVYFRENRWEVDFLFPLWYSLEISENFFSS